MGHRWRAPLIKQKSDCERTKITLSSSPLIIVHRAQAQVAGSETDHTPVSGWLTAQEAADYLRVRVRSLLLWVRQGKIKGYALSGTKRRIWRFRTEDLDTALLSHPVLMSEAPTVLSKPERRIA